MNKQTIGITMWILGMIMTVAGVFTFTSDDVLFTIVNMILGLALLFWSHHLMQSGNKLISSVEKQSKKKEKRK